MNEDLKDYAKYNPQPSSHDSQQFKLREQEIINAERAALAREAEEARRRQTQAGS